MELEHSGEFDSENLKPAGELVQMHLIISGPVRFGDGPGLPSQEFYFTADGKLIPAQEVALGDAETIVTGADSAIGTVKNDSPKIALDDAELNVTSNIEHPNFELRQSGMACPSKGVSEGGHSSKSQATYGPEETTGEEQETKFRSVTTGQLLTCKERHWVEGPWGEGPGGTKLQTINFVHCDHAPYGKERQ